MGDTKKDILLVDGYNVIHDWPELIVFKDQMDHARDRLVDSMAGYGVYKNFRVVIVFDAHGIPGESTCRTVFKDLEVVFTSEGETADSYIERMSYCLVRQGERVFVVTSDWAEQTVILGAGAFRISARELGQAVRKFKKTAGEEFGDSIPNYRRQELANRLSREVRQRLDEIRRGR